ncbi:MAG: MFS transporter [Acetobacteraceae bacterium]
MSDTTLGQRLDRVNVTGFHKRVLGLIAAGMFFDSFDIYIAGAVLGAMVQSGESDLSHNAMFLSATFLGMMLGAWVAGVLGDRYGRRFSYQFNLALYGGASIAGALMPDINWLILCRFVMGLGMGAEIVVGYGTLSEFIPARARGRFGTILNLIINTSLFLATFLGWLIIPRFGWRWMFVIVGVGAFVVWFLRKNMPESPRWLAEHGRVREAEAIVRTIEAESGIAPGGPPIQTQPERSIGVGALFGPALLRNTLVGITVLVALFIVNFAFVAWVPTFLVKQGHGISGSLGLTALMFAGGPLGSLIGFALADGVGRKWGIVAGSLVGLVLVVCYAVVESNIGLSIVGFLVTCVIYVLSSLSVAVYVPELFPTSLRMRGTGLCNAVGRAVSIAIPYGVAGIFTVAGLTGVMALIFVTLLVQAVIVGIFGPETKRRSLEELGQVLDAAAPAGLVGQASQAGHG